MKKLLTLIIAVFTAANIHAQSFMTNIINKCEIWTNERCEIAGAMQDIAHDYQIRICSEDATLRQGIPMTFTNATLEHVFTSIMTNATDHTWRYDENTDTIYVYPLTNAITMMRIGPIAITNSPIGDFFYEDDMLNFHNLGKLRNMLSFYPVYDGPHLTFENISLEMGESYVWEVLDEICKKATVMNCWQIRKIFVGSECRYELVFQRIESFSPLWKR